MKSLLVFKPNQHSQTFCPMKPFANLSSLHSLTPPRSIYCTRTFARIIQPPADLYSIIRRQLIKINAPKALTVRCASISRAKDLRTFVNFHIRCALVRCVAGVQRTDWSTIIGEQKNRHFGCVYHPSGEKNLE